MVVHYQTWPTFVYTNRQIPNSIPSWRQIKNCCINFQKLLLLVFLTFSRAKQLLMELLFESLQTYANQLSRFMLANFIHIRCVNPSASVFIRIGISIQRQVDSHLDKARPRALKKRICPSFSEQNPIAKSRVSIKQADKNWLLQWGKFLFSLQHWFWIHELLLSLLSLSRSSPSLSEEDVERVSKKRELVELRHS